jgi:hypothetical protein
MSPPPDTALRLFRRFYGSRFDLLTVDGALIAVPKDGSIPVYSGETLSEVALQIAEAAS